MTSTRYNERKRRAAEEMEIFDRLPEAVREAINKAQGSVRASSVLSALLRGVPEDQIIATLLKEPKK